MVTPLRPKYIPYTYTDPLGPLMVTGATGVLHMEDMEPLAIASGSRGDVGRVTTSSSLPDFTTEALRPGGV